MGIQYISTATTGNAHQSDILGVAVSKNFTITCSSDGFIKLWSNLNSERTFKTQLLVDKLGLHHLTIFEDTIHAKKVLLIAAVSYNGYAYLFTYNFESKQLELINNDQLPAQLKDEHVSYWDCQFAKDPVGEFHCLALTLINGSTQLFSLDFNEEDATPIFEYKDATTTKETSFATCIDLDPVHRKIAVGHENGNVYIYDYERLKLVYEFNAPVKGKKNDVSEESGFSTTRSVKFSPGGTLLAVARDSGFFGMIALYDVKFGEIVGALNSATHSSVAGVGGFAHAKWCLSLSFNEEGNLIASGGLDGKVKIWNVDTKECDAVITINKTDVSDDNLEKENVLDSATCCCLSFIDKGLIPNEGTNDGLVIVGFDRAIRWFREAGGI